MSGLTRIRKHPALLLLAAFVSTSVLFIACGGSYDDFRNDEDEDGGSSSCVPFTARKCRGPSGCVGEQSCLATGNGHTACICTTRARPDASEDAPSSNDASDDAPSSNDASDDAPSSNDASGDAPSSNGWGMLELLDSIR